MKFNSMTAISLLMVLVLSGLLDWGCSGTKKQQPPEDPPAEPTVEVPVIRAKEVAKGNYCSIEKLDNRLVTHPKEWSVLWKKMHEGQSPIPKTPFVDFGKESVIACYMGGQRSGGFSIEVKEITCNDGTLDATLIHHEPGRSCLLTMALTQPYLIVSIPRCEATTKNFDIETKLRNCDD